VDRDRARALLAQVAAGHVAPDDALDALVMAPYDDLGHSRPDVSRALRTGDPEVVYGAGKTTGQVLDVVAALAGDRAVLVTRASADAVDALRERYPAAVVDGGTVAVGPLPRLVDSRVTRWGGGLPQYAVGHLQLVARLRRALPAGLAVAGAAYDGVGVPACAHSGLLAARAVALGAVRG